MKRLDTKSGLLAALLTLAILALLWFLCWMFSDNRFTFDTVMKLHVHQSYPEVVGILGKPDKVTMEQDASPTYVAATWGKYPNPEIALVFMDGEVNSIHLHGIQNVKSVRDGDN